MRNFLTTLLIVTALAAGTCPARAQHLYWLDTNYGAPALHRADADGLGATDVPLAPASLPEGLAAAASGAVYWADSALSNSAISRAAADLSNIQQVLAGGSAWRGVAIDDTAQLLYWTSSNLVTGPKVHRSSVTGSGAAVLVALPSAANPRGIAVDHGGGAIYWADFDCDAIYSADLDGAAPTLWLQLAPGSAPYGVAVDPVQQFIYWTEYNSGTLRRASLTTGVPSTLVTGLLNPTYVALDLSAGRIYWAEGGAGAQRIQRSSLTGGSVVTLPAPLTTYGGIAFGGGGTTGVTAEAPPSEFAIDRVWPSPGRGSIRVAFSLPKATRVRLSVLDVQGRQVAVLDEGVLPAGRHERFWSGRSHGRAAPAGVYFVRLAAEGRTWVRRIVLAH